MTETGRKRAVERERDKAEVEVCFGERREEGKKTLRVKIFADSLKNRRIIMRLGCQ